MRWIIAVSLIWLHACAHTPAILSDYPDYWPPTLAGEGNVCAAPVGLFSNMAELSSSDDPAPALAELLFEDRLAGFPVEAVQIDEGTDGLSLIVTGVLAGVPLNTHRVIHRDGDACDSRWQFVTDTGATGASLRSTALMYTAGLVMPLTEKYHGVLQRSVDGDLMIRVKRRGRYLGALVVPLSHTEENWLWYAQHGLKDETALPEARDSEPDQ